MKWRGAESVLPRAYDVYVRFRLNVFPEDGREPPSEYDAVSYVQSGVDLMMANGFPDSNPQLVVDYAQVIRVESDR